VNHWVNGIDVRKN